METKTKTKPKTKWWGCGKDGERGERATQTKKNQATTTWTIDEENEVEKHQLKKNV